MAANENKFSGIFPAFYACYDDAGEVSEERTVEYLKFLYSKGIRGLYVNGSSGECIYLSMDERMRILEAVMRFAKGKMTVIAHVGANSTKDSMKLASHAEKCRVDAIAAIPPIYFKLPDHAIAAYWNSISESAANTPMFLYNIPQCAGVALHASLLGQMLKNKRIIGVKNSSMEVLDILNYKEIGGKDFNIFNGTDEHYVAGRIMGANGGIGGTYGVMPELYLAMEKHIQAGKAHECYPIQAKCNEIIKKMCSCEGSMYAVIKALLESQGIKCGSVRAPLYACTENDLITIKQCNYLIRDAIQEYC